TSQVFPSDHYFRVFDAAPEQPITPRELIQQGTTHRAIVLATAGGGIQAAGWTAKVIEGLEQYCRGAHTGACQADPQIFGKSIRLISSVSGGSVGAMYVVNEYDPQTGELPAVLGTAFAEATRSSLDDVIWGLVYPDFLRTILYFPFRLDRGQALEDAWRANAARQPDIRRAFAQWRRGTNDGRLPGVIFNATVTETGQRLLLNTAGIEVGAATLRFNDLGGGRYQSKDLAIATAARLSSSFTYVTPVARSDEDPRHMADGGYYD